MMFKFCATNVLASVPRLSHEAVTVIELYIEGPKLNCEKRPLCFLFLRYDTAIHFFYVYVEYF